MTVNPTPVAMSVTHFLDKGDCPYYRFFVKKQVKRKITSAMMTIVPPLANPK
jgi:hypothetical protein